MLRTSSSATRGRSKSLSAKRFNSVSIKSLPDLSPKKSHKVEPDVVDNGAAAAAVAENTAVNARSAAKKPKQPNKVISCTHQGAAQTSTFASGKCRICEAAAHKKQATHKAKFKYKKTVFQVDETQNEAANQIIVAWLEEIKRQLIMPVSSMEEFQRGIKILEDANTNIESLAVPPVIKKSQFREQCSNSLAKLSKQYRIAGAYLLRPYALQTAQQKLSVLLADSPSPQAVASIAQCKAIIDTIDHEITNSTALLTSVLSEIELQTQKEYYEMLEKKQHEYQQILEKCNARVVQLFEITNQKIIAARTAILEQDQTIIIRSTKEIIAKELSEIPRLGESALIKDGFAIFLTKYLEHISDKLDSLEKRLTALRLATARELELDLMQQQLRTMPPAQRLVKMKQDLATLTHSPNARTGLHFSYINYLEANIPSLEQSVAKAQQIFAEHPAHSTAGLVAERAAAYLRTRRKSLGATPNAAALASGAEQVAKANAALRASST